MLRQGHASVPAISFGSYVHHVSIDDEVMGKQFLATIVERWLMNFGEKTDHLTIGHYRTALNLR